VDKFWVCDGPYGEKQWHWYNRGITVGPLCGATAVGGSWPHKGGLPPVPSGEPEGSVGATRTEGAILCPECKRLWDAYHEEKTITLTPELRDALTQLFDDGQQNWDRGCGWPPPDRKDSKAYELLLPLTNYGLTKPEADWVDWYEEEPDATVEAKTP